MNNLVEATVKKDVHKSALHNPIAKEEKISALTNISILVKTKENWSWEALSEFLHYLDTEQTKKIIMVLVSEGYITCEIGTKGVKKLTIICEMEG